MLLTNLSRHLILVLSELIYTSTKNELHKLMYCKKTKTNSLIYLDKGKDN